MPHTIQLSPFEPKEQLSQSLARIPLPQWVLPQLRQLSFFEPKEQLSQTLASFPLPQWVLPQLKQLSFFEPKEQLSHNLPVAIFNDFLKINTKKCRKYSQIKTLKDFSPRCLFDNPRLLFLCSMQLGIFYHQHRWCNVYCLLWLYSRFEHTDRRWFQILFQLFRRFYFR